MSSLTRIATISPVPTIEPTFGLLLLLDEPEDVASAAFDTELEMPPEPVEDDPPCVGCEPPETFCPWDCPYELF